MMQKLPSNPSSESESAILITDIFNVEELQRMQDLFSDATGVASLITQPDGTPVTRPSNFCHLCESIIRKTEIGLSNCLRSDSTLGCYNTLGPIMQPCLSVGLWDTGASISVGGKHICSWLIGQVRNEQNDEKQMLEYADKIGADREAFSAALAEVPVMSVKQFEKISEMLFEFAN